MALECCLGFLLRTKQQNSQSESRGCMLMSRRSVEIVMVRKNLFDSFDTKLYPAYEVVCLEWKNCIDKDEKGCWSCENLPKVLIFRGKEILSSLRRRKHLESKRTKILKIQPTLDFHKLLKQNKTI